MSFFKIKHKCKVCGGDLINLTSRKDCEWYICIKCDSTSEIDQKRIQMLEQLQKHDEIDAESIRLTIAIKKQTHNYS